MRIFFDEEEDMYPVPIKYCDSSSILQRFSVVMNNAVCPSVRVEGETPSNNLQINGTPLVSSRLASLSFAA